MSSITPLPSVTRLDLADIQGNIVLPYGRYGFPWARHLLFHVADAAAGRRFLAGLYPILTSAQRWRQAPAESSPASVPRPAWALNLGLTFSGMRALHLPTRTLDSLPEEFVDGMAARAHILGDYGRSARGAWDPVWRADTASAQVHLWVLISTPATSDGQPVAALAERTDWLLALAAACGGVRLLEGHRGSEPRWQDCSAIMASLPDGSRVPTAREHFGYTDGISDPVFAGQYPAPDSAIEVPGGGRLDPEHQAWQALAAGEFVLGHPCEAQELPEAAPPWTFTRNGTFMALRKLHQNLGSVDRSLADQATRYRQAQGGGISDDEARATLMAKFAGRWPSGIPLMAAPTYARAQELAARYADVPSIQRKVTGDRTPEEVARLQAFELLLNDFRYGADPAGAVCPLTAHTRRTNPRDGLDPRLGVVGHVADTSMSNRRRILRRGLPYGDSGRREDEGEHGVLFMAVCASLFRQFEFVQQQWVQYGSVFGAGGDTDPLIGTRGTHDRFTIPADPAGEGVPFLCGRLPQYVETRGGEYFFLPSLSAVRRMAEGTVDPT